MIFQEIFKLYYDNLELANTKSRNDFIEEVTKFYVNYLNTKHNNLFSSEPIEPVLKSSIEISEERFAKPLFNI